MVSLAEQLAELANPIPQFSAVQEEEEEGVHAQVTEADPEREEEDTTERSYLRTATAGGLQDDVRYRGKKVKRKNLREDDEKDLTDHAGAELGHMFDFGEDEDKDEYSDGDDTADTSMQDIDLDDQEMDVGDDDEDEESEDEANSNDSEEEFDNNDNYAACVEVKVKTVEPTVKLNEGDTSLAKSQAVVGQLSAWDKLLEQRIFLQKMLSKVNTFPDRLTDLVEAGDQEYQQLAGSAKQTLASLAVKQVQLQNCVERLPAEQCSALGGADSAQLANWLGESHSMAQPGRRKAVARWGERTARLGRLASLNTPALQQVDQIVANMPRLVRRTRQARAETAVLGRPRCHTAQEQPNIFDDSDFYHGLLRELIEKKTGAGGAAGSDGAQWLQIQKLRSRLKKKVDTRASKGRKVRYDVHTKLVSFMAPVPESNRMPDSARKELFASLFGTRKIVAA